MKLLQNSNAPYPLQIIEYEILPGGGRATEFGWGIVTLFRFSRDLDRGILPDLVLEPGLPAKVRAGYKFDGGSFTKRLISSENKIYFCSENSDETFLPQDGFTQPGEKVGLV